MATSRISTDCTATPQLAVFSAIAARSRSSTQRRSASRRESSDAPKHNGIDTDGNRVARQRLFCGNAYRADAQVNNGGDDVDKRDQEIKPRTAYGMKTAKSEHNGARPFIGNATRQRKDDNDRCHDQNYRHAFLTFRFWI